MTTITKDTIISDLMNINIGCLPILMAEGMHCIGCPASQGETIEEACAVHGIDPDSMVQKINEFLKSQEE